MRIIMKAYQESFEIFQKRFSRNLTKAFKEAGLTQRNQVLAGLDPRYVARIKKGESNPTLMTIWRLCKTASIDPEILFKKKA